MPIERRHTPRARFYIQLRRKNVPKDKAKGQSLFMSEIYPDLNRLKKKDYPSSNAFMGAKTIASARNIQDLAAVQHQKVSIHEARDLLLFNRNFATLLHNHPALWHKIPGNELIFPMIALYCMVRQKRSHPHTVKEARAFVENMAQLIFGRLTPRQRRSLLSEPIELSAGLEEGIIVDLPEFYERVVRESARNKPREGLESLPNQKRGIELAFNLMINADQAWIKTVSSFIKRLNAPPHEEELEQLRKRIRNFDDRKSEQKELVRGYRMRVLGNALADALDFVIKNSGMDTDVKAWIGSSLKNPENKKFLADKAIEWMGVGPSKLS